MPYRRFLKAQLAGDLMGDASSFPARVCSAPGRGIWRLHSRRKRAPMSGTTVSTWSRAACSALPLACARCRDHKYDPITARDYYARRCLRQHGLQEYPLVPAAQAKRGNGRKGSG
jgi:hypothetical protein